jgi:hypothetical protein
VKQVRQLLAFMNGAKGMIFSQMLSNTLDEQGPQQQ